MLQASDFAQGSAKYQTEVIDDVVAERRITSSEDPIPVHFGATEAGVYVVEVSSQDRVGRTQTVKVDLFMAGDTPVTWQAPPLADRHALDRQGPLRPLARRRPC